eukprot:tig00021108_g18326.t1
MPNSGSPGPPATSTPARRGSIAGRRSSSFRIDGNGTVDGKPLWQPFFLHFYDKATEDAFVSNWRATISKYNLTIMPVIFILGIAFGVPAIISKDTEDKRVKVGIATAVAVGAGFLIITTVGIIDRIRRRRLGPADATNPQPANKLLISLVVIVRLSVYIAAFSVVWLFVDLDPGLYIAVTQIVLCITFVGGRVMFIQLLPVLGVTVALFFGGYCSNARASFDANFALHVNVLAGSCASMGLSVWFFERRMREDFLRTSWMQRRIGELRSIIQAGGLSEERANAQGNAAIDIEAPMQKALAFLHSLSANAGLPIQERESLQFLIEILTSNRNVFAPDISQQIEDGKVRVDNETKQWLITELGAGDGTGEMEPGAQGPGSGATTRPATTRQGEQRPKPERPGSVSEGDEAGLVAALDEPTEGHLGRARLLQADFEVASMLSRCDRWLGFDVFRLTELTKGRPLLVLGSHLFERYGLVERLKLSPTRLSTFLAKLEQRYMENPYHNGTHAADVLQSMHFIMGPGGLSAYLPPEKDRDRDIVMMAALFAAIAHDTAHPGVNNAFHVANQMELAVTYNDKSVLENYHVASSFRLLREADCDFLEGRLSRTERQEFRRIAISMVLATDLALHFETLGQFKTRITAPNFGTPDDLRLLLNMGLKVADVGHASKELPLHLRWSARVMEEFFAQGDQEKARSLPCSPFMDRLTTNVPNCQTGFLDFIVQPAIEAWAQFLPGCAPLHGELAKNHAHWKREAGAAEAAAAGSPPPGVLSALREAAHAQPWQPERLSGGYSAAAGTPHPLPLRRGSIPPAGPPPGDAPPARQPSTLRSSSSLASPTAPGGARTPSSGGPPRKLSNGVALTAPMLEDEPVTPSVPSLRDPPSPPGAVPLEPPDRPPPGLARDGAASPASLASEPLDR